MIILPRLANLKLAPFFCREHATVKMIARNDAGVEVPTGSSAVFCGEHVSLVLAGIEQVGGVGFFAPLRQPSARVII